MSTGSDNSYSHQPLTDISIIYAALGVKKAVLSPGSRCAPLAISFARNPKIETLTISDERSAAFIALGIAQQENTPVVIICTSGTAAMNYGPAMAEAYLQNIPLLVLTADRPVEWVGQQDGQTIYQNGLHSLHTKKSYQLPIDYSHSDAVWHIHRIASESFNLSTRYPQGPVHLNIPIREPFYPAKHTVLDFEKDIKVIEEESNEFSLSNTVKEQLKALLNSQEKVLVVGGQDRVNSLLNQELSRLAYPIVNDVISNLHSVDHTINHQDLFLQQLTSDQSKRLQPDFLITFGKSVISKQLKLFLRKNKPKHHWHIQKDGEVADTFQSLTKVIRCNELSFFQSLNSITQTEKKFQFKEFWLEKSRNTATIIQSFFQKATFNEAEIVKKVLEALPDGCHLHLANSMAVRYANYVGITQKNIEVFANRGTSGIDGSVSTAVGHAISDRSKLNVLITGDLSLFYDRNAFWNNYLPSNFKIVLLNNHGGVIFKMIDGPAKQPEADEYFQTKQTLNANFLAQEMNLNYLFTKEWKSFDSDLNSFLEEKNQCFLWEIESISENSVSTINALKKEIQKKLI